LVSLPPHSVIILIEALFSKKAFCPKKNEQSKIHLILYIWKKKKIIKTTITFEPNFKKKLIS
jgi:hypothetical protein